MSKEKPETKTTAASKALPTSSGSAWQFLWCDEDEHDYSIESDREVKWFRRTYKGTLKQAARKFERWAEYRYILLDEEIHGSNGEVCHLEDCGLAHFGT